VVNNLKTIISLFSHYLLGIHEKDLYFIEYGKIIHFVISFIYLAG